VREWYERSTLEYEWECAIKSKAARWQPHPQTSTTDWITIKAIVECIRVERKFQNIHWIQKRTQLIEKGGSTWKCPQMEGV